MIDAINISMQVLCGQKFGLFFFIIQTVRMPSHTALSCFHGSCSVGLLCPAAAATRGYPELKMPGASAEESGGVKLGIENHFKIEGHASVPWVMLQDGISLTWVLVDGEEHVRFLKTGMSFMVRDIHSRSYVVETTSPAYRFDHIQMDITSKGKMRARYASYIKTSEVVR